jgi:GTP-binding protein
LTFVDYFATKCIGGNGGNGMISFLREYNMPFGGPDGGNGGSGGHVIFKGKLVSLLSISYSFSASSQTKDLCRLLPVMRAPKGEMGGDRCCHGKSAEHEVISVRFHIIH